MKLVGHSVVQRRWSHQEFLLSLLLDQALLGTRHEYEKTAHRLYPHVHSKYPGQRYTQRTTAILRIYPQILVSRLQFPSSTGESVSEPSKFHCRRFYYTAE